MTKPIVFSGVQAFRRINYRELFRCTSQLVKMQEDYGVYFLRG